MLKIFKSIFTNKTKSIGREYFPLSQKSPNKIPPEKLLVKGADFKKLLSSEISQKLNDLGFIGSDNIYRREHKTHSDFIIFGTYKSGGAISIDAAVNFKPPYALSEFDIKQDYAFLNGDSLIRLSPDAEDNWWRYRNTKQENLEVISEMWNLIELKALPYFKSFDPLSSFFDTIKIDDISTENIYVKYNLTRKEKAIYYALMNHFSMTTQKEKALLVAHKGLITAEQNNDVQYKSLFQTFIDNEAL